MNPSTPPSNSGLPGSPPTSGASEAENETFQEPSQGRQQPGQNKKEFQLKKNHGGGEAVQGKAEDKQEGISGKKEEAKATKTEGIDATAKAMQIRQIASTVVKMVDGLMHGDGITQMTLKASKDVPISFHGTQLTIDQAASKISFQNFKTEQAAMDARDQINQNPEELQKLADQLYERGFRNTTMELGNSITVQLPTATQAPQTPASMMHDQSSMEREGGGQQGGQQQRGDRGGGGPEGEE